MTKLHRSSIRLFLHTLAICLTGWTGLSAKEAPEKRVVVVANSAFSGSEKVARAYLKHRNIPESHLVLLDAPVAETISRQEYLDKVHNPLIEQLLARQLVDGMAGSADAFGRNSPIVLKNDIQYMVLCHGMPLRVSGQPLEQVDDLSLREQMLTGANQQYIEAFSQGPLAKNEASLDGELATLLMRGVPLNGFLPNPYFRRKSQTMPGDLAIKVTRLDGPSPKAVLMMLKQSMEAERSGLMGRAYVDEDGRGGGFAQGNAWMAATAELFEKLGFDLSHDTARQTFGEADRFDAPVLYAGWYAGGINGPFTLPGFRFPPGAIAVHLHSYSAATLRSSSQRWAGPLIERGVSATLGNVYEPYLMLTHHLHFFFMALADGWNFADAAYFALPGLSWQGVAIGDPLYRPFAIDLQKQVSDQASLKFYKRNPYALIRQVNRMQSADMADAADSLLRRAMIDSPATALALHRADKLLAMEEQDDALRVLDLFTRLKPSDSSEWGLYAQAADHLSKLGEPEDALKIYRDLMAQPMPQPVNKAFMKRAVPVAEAANRMDLAAEWRAILTPPPPPPAEGAGTDTQNP